MGNIRRNLVLVAATVLLVSGCASESLGPEYGEISEEESGLQFNAPGLEGGYRKFISGQDEKFIDRLVGVYGPRQGEFPHGQLVLIEMPPGRHFTRINPPKDSIDNWGPFKNRTITHGPAGTAVNAIGRIDYAAFLADNLSCVVFRQPFGTVHDTGRGTRLLDGYYCKGEAPMMTEGEATRVVQALNYKSSSYASRKNSRNGEEGTIPVRVVWEIRSGAAWRHSLDNMGGLIVLPEGDQPGRFSAWGSMSGDCEGEVTRAQQSGANNEWLWSLDCPDGNSATGTLTVDGSEIRGTGRSDKRGRITLSPGR